MVVVGLVLSIVLTGCGSDTPEKPTISSADAREKVCKLVRLGVTAYNDKDFDAVRPYFVEAKPFAQIHADGSKKSDASDLLEAVVFFAEVPPEEYSKDAASLKLFEKYKAITLGDCVDGQETGQST